MKNLIIVGAGGLGRTVYNIAICSRGYKIDFEIKGFLEFDINKLDGFEGYPPIIGNEDQYNIENNDVFVLGVGGNTIRRKIIQKLEEKGAVFYSLIHKTAYMETNTIIGDGTIMAANSYIGCDTIVGANCFIQNNAVIGHDVRIGNNCRIDCNSMLVGGTKVGNNATIHTSAVISHKVTIEDNTTISACSFVVRDVKEGTTVLGNPAKQIFIPKV